MIITKVINQLFTNLVEDKLGVLNEKRCKKRLVPGRTSGYYVGIERGVTPLHILYPYEKEGQIIKQVGVSICDNKYISLSKNSEHDIIIDNATSLVGVIYTCFTILLNFICLYNLHKTTITFITALYNILIEIGGLIVTFV